jgi:DNA-binding HxlR family transcriptional regulator
MSGRRKIEYTNAITPVEGINREFAEPGCTLNEIAPLIARALDLISGKWKVLILDQLALRPTRYGRLHRLLPALSAKVLTQQLRALERDGLIYREYDIGMEKHVGYAITSRGEDLWNGLMPIGIWARDSWQRVTALEPTKKGRKIISITGRSVNGDGSDSAPLVSSSASRAEPRHQFRDPAQIRQCQ